MSLKCDNTEFTKKPNKTICAWCEFLEEHFCLTKPHRFPSFILIGSLYPPPYPQQWGGFLKCKKNLKNQRDHKLTDILKAVNHNWTLSICTYMCTVKLFLRPWCYHKGNFTPLSHPWLTTWSNVTLTFEKDHKVICLQLQLCLSALPQHVPHISMLSMYFPSPSFFTNAMFGDLSLILCCTWITWRSRK